MKNFLFSSIAVLIAAGLSAYTSTGKKARLNYYRFHYINTSYSKAAVENETVPYWGYGTLVTATGDFTSACDGTEDRACEIIVPESCTVDTLSGRRMKSVQAGDDPTTSVFITANEGSETGKYKVAGGIFVLAWMNKD